VAGTQAQHAVLTVGDAAGGSDETPALAQRSDRLTVTTASTAAEAVETLGRREIDCVVSAYDLPASNGIALLESVRERAGDLPFVLVTAEGSEAVASEAISAGVTEYLRSETLADESRAVADAVLDVVDGATPSTGGRTRRRERHRRIVSRVTDAVVEVDAEWRFTLVNDQAEQLYGMAEADLLGTAFWDVFTDARGTRFEAAYREVMRTREPTSFVEYYDGLDAWFDIQVYPNDDGGLAFYFRDVTDRREQSRELEVAQARYRALAEHFPNGGVFYFDDDCRYQMVSGSGFDPIDTDPDDLVGNVPSDVDRYSTATAERMRSTMEATLQGESEELELTYEGRVFRLQSAPVRDDDGEVIAGLYITQDITDRHESKAELERRDRRFDYVERVAEIGYWEIDTGTEPPHDVSWTDGVYRIHDLSPDVPADVKHGLSFYHPEDREAVTEAVERAIEAGEPYEYEARIVTDDGRERWTRSVGEPVESDGEVVRVRGVFQDITEQKRQERKLARQNERLEEFASIVSHDLKNPLMVAQGNVELTQAETDRDADHLATATEALQRADQLVDDLLVLARQGEDLRTLETVALETVVQESWDTVASAQATLSVESEQRVRADPSRLQQLLSNLLRNAVKHGGEAVDITVGDLDDGFYLEDDGVGIAPGEQESVFETGYSTAEDGTGFGLRIIDRIATAHGWEVSLGETPESGARFEITGVEPGGA